MNNILLIQPPIKDFYLTVKRTVPYGLACIGSALIKEGFSVKILDALATNKAKIIDLPESMLYLKKYYRGTDISPFALFNNFKRFGYSFEFIGKTARDYGAFLIGISSLFTAYSQDAIKTAETVKKFCPQSLIVMGGHHPTAMPEQVIREKAVDFVIRGEGEVSMHILAKTIKQGGNFEAIPGIVFCKKNKSIHINEPARIESQEQFYMPAGHLIKNSFYKRKKRGNIVVVGTRGCPMRCAYCSFGSSVCRYRKRSVKSIVREIEEGISKYDAGFIDFEDENLSFDKQWFIKLLKELILYFGKVKPELRAMNGLFPSSLDEETIYTMKQAGFKTLNLSLGSTSKQQLKRFNRPDVRESFDKSLVCAEKYGLDAVGYVIAGAPFQKGEDSVSDLIYLSKRKVLAGISIFYPSPESACFEEVKRLGLLTENSLMRSSCLPISHTTTRLESATILRLGRILNFIKSLVDLKISIPGPVPFKKIDTCKDINIIERGRRLIQYFLYDGKIRGISPEGDIFEHKISLKLTGKFIKKLEIDKIRGVKTCISR